MTPPSPLFSVVVPTRGDAAKVGLLIAALERQTLPRERWESVWTFDGTAPTPEIVRRLEGLGARVEVLQERRGPGGARNAGARKARGDYLAFTEDDCLPHSDWLARAAARLEREPEIDVLDGATVRPDGRPSRRPDSDHPHYLPTNLFVRRTVFDRMGGYCEDFFDAARGVYFREDSDFGFTLEEAGARIAREPEARVVHPVEHPGFLDPLRWARRYEMDPLLERRHPKRFRERIEVHRAGPFVVRRLFVRACFAYLIALAASVAALVLGERATAALALVIAAATLLAVWAKWRFEPLRLPVIPLVPFVLALSLIRGLRPRRR